MTRLLIFLLTAVSLFAETATFELDPARTKVAFQLDSLLHTVHGTFSLQRGTMQYDTATGQASGEIVVNAASGQSGSEGRDAKMHKSILESAKFTEITFTPDRVQGQVAAQGDSEVQVHGSLTLRGQKHEMTLPFKLQRTGDSLRATTRFEIPYVEWGLKNPSTLILRVSQKVAIGIDAAGSLRSGASR
jgi:polyisoprenoid-binding protein YceI